MWNTKTELDSKLDVMLPKKKKGKMIMLWKTYLNYLLLIAHFLELCVQVLASSLQAYASDAGDKEKKSDAEETLLLYKHYMTVGLVRRGEGQGVRMGKT